MKVVLVLCALIAVAYCNPAEVYTIDDCIGICHNAGYIDKRGRQISGVKTKYEICCPGKKFDNTYKLVGFSEAMTAEQVEPAMKSNLDAIQKKMNAKNCKVQVAPMREAKEVLLYG